MPSLFGPGTNQNDQLASNLSRGRVVRKLKAKKVVADILAGMTDRQLMRKYGLTPENLGKLLDQHAHLYKESSTYGTIVNSIKCRRSPRLDIPVPIRCYNYRTSQKGFVRDISENGLRVAGIEAQRGEIMTLCLPLQELSNAEPIDLMTVCRWSKIKGKRKEYSVTGFEITDISQKARIQLDELVKFARELSCGDAQTQDGSLDTWELIDTPRVIEAGIEPARFSGEITGVDILEVVQFALLSGMKTVLVIGSSNNKESRLYLDRGKILHAYHGDKEGEDAFFACMLLDTGKFLFETWTEPVKHSVKAHVDWLLFEAARKRDDVRDAL